MGTLSGPYSDCLTNSLATIFIFPDLNKEFSTALSENSLGSSGKRSLVLFTPSPSLSVSELSPIPSPSRSLLSNPASVKSLQPSYLKLIENVKLSITQKVDVNSEYVKINSIEISPINIEGTLKDILRVLIQDPSDDLIDNIYIDITDNTKPKIGKYKITPNSFIKQDEFQTLLEEIKEIYIKNGLIIIISNL